VFLFTALLTLLAVEAGYRLGRCWQQKRPHEADPGIGTVVGASLGLLAFLLAVITGIAIGRFDARRALVVDETNAIGTTYLRSGYLDEPYRTEIRDLLRQYVDMRLDVVASGEFETGRARAEQIHTALWTRAEALARADRGSEMVALFIESLNEVIDLHTTSLVAVTASRIPPTFWWVLYGITIVTMMMVGFQVSFGSRRDPIALVLLVLVLAAVILLIVDLDRPLHGALRVNPQAMQNLQQEMHSGER
jgi:multidrug transporter EmrE-like cation transporter